MATYTTGEIAAKADVNVHTVRYYEERGLLPRVPRTGSGYRQFGDRHVAHIRFIQRAQRLGFTLEEIGELLDLRAEGDAGEEVREKAEAKLAEVDEKIRDLQRIRAKLTELVEACAHHGDAEDCLILHALEEPGGVEERGGVEE